MLIERVGELQAASGEDGHFERRNTLETPSCIGDRLRQVDFALTDGRELFLVGVDVALVIGGILRGEQDGGPVSAVLTAFKEDMALPVSVFGPVLN